MRGRSRNVEVHGHASRASLHQPLTPSVVVCRHDTLDLDSHVANEEEDELLQGIGVLEQGRISRTRV